MGIIDQTRSHDKVQNPGFVYFATNPSMPGIVKIGCSRHPKVRIQQLSCTTSVPEPFELCFWQFVLDMEWMEQTLHRMLDHLRVSQDREFFRIEVDQAVKVFSDWAFPLGLIPVPGVDYDIGPEGVMTTHGGRIPKSGQPLDWQHAPETKFMVDQARKEKGGNR